jgi:hypothetical protein
MDLPDNVRAALETELAGVEARLVRADDVQRVKLEQRANDIRVALGVAVAEKPKRRNAVGRETRPVDPAPEVR